MLFNSLEFAVFFPLVTAGYFLLPQRHRWILLLVASYAFYMAYKPAYGLLLFASTAIDWFVGLRMPGASTLGRRRAWLGVSLAGNLGMLFSFKYWNLANGTAAAVVPSWPIPVHDWILPIGISFYTFQTLSYSIDVYRGTLAPEPSLARFALYVSFFPQLVAGPIERATRLLPQLQRPTVFDVDRLASGLRLVAWGLFKKVVVADRVAVVADAVYSDPRDFLGVGLAIGTVFFMYQVYCDFSGYSDIAIGTARVLGFDLVANFDSPYTARTITDLINRWHVSLTTWFRDYVYLPLGGNRVSFARWSFNVMLVFVMSGFWHGAAWHYVLWGASLGVAMVVDRATRPLRDRAAAALGVPEAVRAPVQVASTLGVWLLTLVAFRGESIADVAYVVTHLGSGWAHALDPSALLVFVERVRLDGWRFGLCVVVAVVAHVVDDLRRRPVWVEWFGGLRRPGRWALDYALVFAVLVFGVWDDTPFLYFQF